MHSLRSWRTASSGFLVIAAAAGCGARSPLRIIEAGVTTHVTTTCPVPISVQQGTATTLMAHSTVTAPATIVAETWSAVDVPPGAQATFDPTTGETTQFMGDTAGAYTVRHVATDSRGDESSCEVTVTVTAPRTSMGTEFWAVSTTNSGLDPQFHFAVAIGNPNTTPVDVTIDGGALTSTVSFTVPARDTVTRTLPWVDALMNFSANGLGPTSARIAGGAYHIHTSAPVTAFQFNPLEFRTGSPSVYSYTNDASLLLPTAALTGSYRVLGHNEWNGDGAFVAVVGTSATPTTVTVTPRAGVVGSSGATGVMAIAANTSQSFTLARGDVLQLISEATAIRECPATLNGDGCDGDEDFTGSVIQADQPIAVFSGNDCANIGTGGACPACDHLEQQLFPLETWGHNAVVSQFRDRSTNTEPSLVRVLSATAGNTVTFTPPGVHAPITLGENEFVELCSSVDFTIDATGPILVGQFMSGASQGTCDTCDAANTLGDPSFVLETPVAQYRHDYEFVVPATYSRSLVNLTMHPNAPLRLDGLPVNINADPIAGTNWEVVRLVVTPGSHVLETTDGQPFGLKVSGVAAYTSYAYPGGLDLGLIAGP